MHNIEHLGIAPGTILGIALGTVHVGIACFEIQLVIAHLGTAPGIVLHKA